MTSSISTAEVESLRTHLGYGSLGIGTPYTPDGFQELFHDVIAAYLTTGPETEAVFGFNAGDSQVTPYAMTGIVPYAKLVVDVGADVEIVSVRSVTPTRFVARFARAHSVGTPIAVMSGTARLRLLLGQADAAWQALQDPSVGATAGLKQVDKGDVEWWAGYRVLKDRLQHYRAIVSQLSSLVRVEPVWPASSTSPALEVY